MKKDILFALVLVFLGGFLSGLFLFSMDRSPEMTGLNKILRDVASQKYDMNNHNCVNFSVELQEALQKAGIKSKIVVGEMQGEGHVWVAIWFEPMSGSFVRTNQDYEESIQCINIIQADIE